MDKEVLLVILTSVWGVLKLMNHRIFMYQRTIRKFRLKGICLVNEDNLYPISHGIMLYVSMLRYVALGGIFYLNMWVGLACIAAGYILTMAAPEQSDVKNLRKALDALKYKYSKGLIDYSDFMLDSLTVERAIGGIEEGDETYVGRQRPYNTKYEQGDELEFIMNGEEQKAEITGITPEGNYIVQIERRVEGVDKNIVDVYTEKEIDRYVEMADRKKSLDHMKDLGYLDSNYRPTQKIDIESVLREVEM